MINSSESCAWAEEILRSLGFEMQCKPQIIRNRPWSQVTCFRTSQGHIYLKSMAQSFSHEPFIVRFLFDHISQEVPEILASHEQLGCFLMKDAGEPLRNILQANFRPELLYHALSSYARIQIKSISATDQLIKARVPDWRLGQLPRLYQELVLKEDVLTTIGLTTPEITHLQSLAPKMHWLCEELANQNIPETLEHGDFHDNNILIQADSLTFNDWGDASITHPFFSCISALESAMRNHPLDNSSPRYITAQKTYLDQWKEYGTDDQRLQAFDLAQKLRPFVAALSLIRIQTCQSPLSPEYAAWITDSLKELMKNLS